MANTASARKRIRQTAKRTERNQARKSRMRTFIKKVEAACPCGNCPRIQAGVTQNPRRSDHAARQVEARTGLGEQLAAQWARIRGRLQREVGEVEYRSWLRNMTLVGIDGDEVTIQLPSGF